MAVESERVLLRARNSKDILELGAVALEFAATGIRSTAAADVLFARRVSHAYVRVCKQSLRKGEQRCQCRSKEMRCLLVENCSDWSQALPSMFVLLALCA